MPPLYKLVLAVIVFVFILLFSASHAYSHGEFKWIMDDKLVRYCCGEEDCTIVSPDLIKPIKGGYKVFWNNKWWDFKRGPDDNNKFTERRIWPSKKNYWAMCVYLNSFNGEIKDGTPRCLFEPPLF